MPPLLHTPDQITERPLVALSVMLVPTAKLAEPVVPTGTFSPAGVERTLSPARPVAVRVSSAVAGAGAPTPPTFATPPPPREPRPLDADEVLIARASRGGLVHCRIADQARRRWGGHRGHERPHPTPGGQLEGRRQGPDGHDADVRGGV